MEDTETLAKKLNEVERSLSEVQETITKLEVKKKKLLKVREDLKDSLLMIKSFTASNKNWSTEEFPWSDRVVDIQKNVFKIDKFRQNQLEVINAVLSKENVIVIMPTGGGKSLCYQLPVLVQKGIGVVISPLISLMEDQVKNLKELNITAVISRTKGKSENEKLVEEEINGKTTNLKIIYATPEKFAKSNFFKSQLQKLHNLGKLIYIAVDEIHCCSEWGHDFRPDYQNLLILKTLFPDVPILGLTATATSKVLADVQRMLDIGGCLVFKSSFNRPNLFFEVRQKPSNQEESIEAVSDLLTTKFKDESGIIYTATIKECEDVMNGLRSRGVKAAAYHASLDLELRNKVHTRWLTGYYQAVVATIAFGLGINKPNVRFVIHYSISKSVDNYYQECGRAGRDGDDAWCILFYRLSDVNKVSPLAIGRKNGIKTFYNMLEYCIDTARCRRRILADHFGEQYDTKLCESMCDHCRFPHKLKVVNITKHAHNLVKIVRHAIECDVNLTVLKLLDAWYGKGPKNIRLEGVRPPSLSREIAESIVAHLLIKNILKEYFNFTAYNTIVYIQEGSDAEDFMRNKELYIKLQGNEESSRLELSETMTDNDFPETLMIKSINRKRKDNEATTSRDEEELSKKKIKKRPKIIDSDSEDSVVEVG